VRDDQRIPTTNLVTVFLGLLSCSQHVRSGTRMCGRKAACQVNIMTASSPLYGAGTPKRLGVVALRDMYIAAQNTTRPAPHAKGQAALPFVFPHISRVHSRACHLAITYVFVHALRPWHDVGARCTQSQNATRCNSQSLCVQMPPANSVLLPLSATLLLLACALSDINLKQLPWKRPRGLPEAFPLWDPSSLAPLGQPADGPNAANWWSICGVRK
jgi:hypothetical protein